MLFVQPIAPQFGVGLAPPEPAVPISGYFFAGHLPGHFGLGIPAHVRRPAFVEDLDVFQEDWGEPVRFDGVDVGLGIFSQPNFTDGIGSIGMASGVPRLLLGTAIVPIRAEDDPTSPVLELTDRMGQLDRRGRPVPFRYIVDEEQPDGTGMTTLLLSVHPDQTTQ